VFSGNFGASIQLNPLYLCPPLVMIDVVRTENYWLFRAKINW